MAHNGSAHVDYSMGGRHAAETMGARSQHTWLGYHLPVPRARLLTSLNFQFLIFKLRELDKELHQVPAQVPWWLSVHSVVLLIKHERASVKNYWGGRCGALAAWKPKFSSVWVRACDLSEQAWQFLVLG